MPIQGVLFDYGLVLTGPPHPPAWERMKATLMVDETPFGEAYWRPRHGYDRGDLSGRVYWRTVAAEVGRRALHDSELDALLDADIELWTRPNQPMIDWAMKLQSAGVPTGILSNLGDEMEAGVLTRCPWMTGFVHRTFSHRLNLAKPEAAIYRHAAEGMGLPAEALLFIDDREDNAEAARAAGMRVIHYTTHADFLREFAVLAANGTAPASMPSPRI